MSTQPVTNPRTATPATIRRATLKARRAVGRLDRETRWELERIYQEAQADLMAAIEGYAGREAGLRLEALQDLSAQVNRRLALLGDERDALLGGALREAAVLGVEPWAGAGSRVVDEALRHVLAFTAEDGLQLADRLWRIDRGARELATRALEQAIIQGHSASEAARGFLERGQPVPGELAAKQNLAQAGRVARAVGGALMSGEASPHAQALRLFRTELNRAHGEAYMAAAEGHPEVAGFRFTLSPRHPKPDICDMHARVNRYGLGPGVYPTRERTPWPAHPNTFSFVQVVFKEEVTDADRAGREGWLDWLKGQPVVVQVGVLKSRAKAAALRAGVLRENEIGTPWGVLRRRYERRGVDVSGF